MARAAAVARLRADAAPLAPAADYTRVTELAPGHAAASAKLRALAPVLEAKREALKAEMMATLKGFGNSLLGKFGLSLDNFKAEQDPATGSYSIQFVQGGGGAGTAPGEAGAAVPAVADEQDAAAFEDTA